MTITASMLSRLVVCTLVSYHMIWDAQNSSLRDWWQLLVIFGHLHQERKKSLMMSFFHFKTRKIIFFQIKIKVITFFSVLTRLSSSIIMKKIWYRGLILSKSSEMTCLYSAHGTIYSHRLPIHSSYHCPRDTIFTTSLD